MSKYFFTIIACLCFFSCSTKQKTFNGTETLNCPSYENKEDKKKKKSKWRLVLYKDNKEVGLKKKRGKSRLFK